MTNKDLLNLCVLNSEAYVLARLGQCKLPEGYTDLIPIIMPLEGCPEFLEGDCIPVWGYTTMSKNKLYIVFRGTQLTTGWKFGQEWLEDAVSLPTQSLGVGKVHYGFYQAWKALRTSMLYAIAKQHPNIETEYIFTGHSLGAAIASIFFVSEHNGRSHTDLVTFGCPRVGDKDFANYLWILPKTLRITNEHDVVPDVPTDPPFRHGGRNMMVKGPGSFCDPKLSHELNSYMEGLKILIND